MKSQHRSQCKQFFAKYTFIGLSSVDVAADTKIFKWYHTCNCINNIAMT